MMPPEKWEIGEAEIVHWPIALGLTEGFQLFWQHEFVAEFETLDAAIDYCKSEFK